MVSTLGFILGAIAIVSAPVLTVVSIGGFLTRGIRVYGRMRDKKLEEELGVRKGEGEPYLTRLEFLHPVQVALLGKSIWFVAWTDAEYGHFCRMEAEMQLGNPKAAEKGLRLLKMGEQRYEKIMAVQKQK